MASAGAAAASAQHSPVGATPAEPGQRSDGAIPAVPSRSPEVLAKQAQMRASRGSATSPVVPPKSPGLLSRSKDGMEAEAATGQGGQQRLVLVRSVRAAEASHCSSAARPEEGGGGEKAEEPHSSSGVGAARHTRAADDHTSGGGTKLLTPPRRPPPPTPGSTSGGGGSPGTHGGGGGGGGGGSGGLTPSCSAVADQKARPPKQPPPLPSSRSPGLRGVSSSSSSAPASQPSQVSPFASPAAAAPPVAAPQPHLVGAAARSPLLPPRSPEVAAKQALMRSPPGDDTGARAVAVAAQPGLSSGPGHQGVTGGAEASGGTRGGASPQLSLIPSSPRPGDSVSSCTTTESSSSSSSSGDRAGGQREGGGSSGGGGGGGSGGGTPATSPPLQSKSPAVQEKQAIMRVAAAQSGRLGQVPTRDPMLPTSLMQRGQLAKDMLGAATADTPTDGGGGGGAQPADARAGGGVVRALGQDLDEAQGRGRTTAAGRTSAGPGQQVQRQAQLAQQVVAAQATENSTHSAGGSGSGGVAAEGARERQDDDASEGVPSTPTPSAAGPDRFALQGVFSPGFDGFKGTCDISNFDEIEKLDYIAKGASGAVFRARWMGMKCAVKVFDCRSEDPEVLDTFRNECFLMRNMHHDNLVRFYGACLDPPAIVTELMVGNLSSLLYGAGASTPSGVRHELTDGRQLAISYGIANGLAVLHHHGVCHRDLKSPNVLYDASLRIKLCDFAFSKFKEKCGEAGTVQMDSRVGTPAWMAPEVLRGEAYSKSADLYSYGVILWEICERREPFKGLNPFTIAHLVGAEHRRLEIPSDCPPLWKQLMIRCWGEPARRPSAGGVVHLLQGLYRLWQHTTVVPDRNPESD
jgi:tRNA A-37 threonylcarbamoyl transferase component Bud32